MFCANCGNELPDGSAFCPKCGAKVGETVPVGNQQNSVSDSGKLKKSRFRILSKVALLLVVFGFFMPVACNHNGFQMADMGLKLGQRGSPAKISAIFLYILFFSALISIGFTIYTYAMKKKIKTILDFPCLLVSIGAGIFAYLVFDKNDIKILKVLQSGGYSIIIGWIASLAFLITDTIYSKNITSAQTKLVETPVKTKKKELTEEEKEQRRITREKRIKQLKKIGIGAGIIFVLLCLVFHNHVGYIVHNINARNRFPNGGFIYESLEQYKNAKRKKAKIPNGTKKIEDGAFELWFSLEEVTIPNSVTEIGSNAFSDCYFLKEITIPDSVTKIGGGAFNYCTSFTSITIPNSVTEIGRSAFMGCKSLTSITIPDSVMKIGEGVFERCDSLISVNYSGTKEQWERIKICREYREGDVDIYREIKIADAAFDINDVLGVNNVKINFNYTGK